MINFITYLILFSILLILPDKSYSENQTEPKSFSTSKFFVKTKAELKVSEATGKISFTSGKISLDRKISRNKITGIKNLFKLNNGDPALFEKYGMSRIYVFSVDMKSELEIKKIINEFNNDKNVEFSEPDFIGISAGVPELKKKDFSEQNFYTNLPNDEMFYRQWYLQNSGSVQPSSGGGFAKIGADIKILNAWEIEKGSEDIIVAILDSGIKDDHPDLKDRMWVNKNEIPNNGIDDDNNGYIDDVRGWDFAYDDKKPDDGFGHGTNIATVIGASVNNSIGFAGIDEKCRLMNCKNLNSDNSGEYGWWAESIKYAVDNGAKIINMSEGGDDYSKVLKTAIDYAVDSDVMVNAAMMNKGDGRDYYPASFKGVFAVGATDTDDKRCRKFSWGGGSCWGNHISVVAPGNKIYGLDYESNTNYEVFWSGTSQSTAIVSGIASLLLAQDISRSTEDIKRIIRSSSKDLVGDSKEDTPGWDKYYGYGRVDCYSALTFENKDSVRFGNEVKEKDEDKDSIEENEQGNDSKKDKPSEAKTKSEPAKPDDK